MTIGLAINLVPKGITPTKIQSFKFVSFTPSYGFMVGGRIGRVFGIFRFDTNIPRPGYIPVGFAQMQKLLNSDGGGGHNA